MSTLFVDTINEKTTNNGVEIPGHIINIQSVNFTGTQTSTSSSFTDITNLSISITPKSSSSKFLLSCCIAASSDSYFNFCRFVRNGTAIHLPDGSASFTRSTSSFSFSSNIIGSSAYQMLFLSAQHLDSPNTASTVTYKVQFATRADQSHSCHINRTHRDLNNSGGYDARGVSTLTVMEIGG
tara:strand:+ start:364 stop:909 length:546 start_codon:yes stop_codon:yes gene_type:complete